ncbi:MAG: hypothetical protein K940chlam7_01576 [Chlamydiae bacterium]|nr:hypothetical protein [Chlamydiota bacterium]
MTIKRVNEDITVQAGVDIAVESCEAEAQTIIPFPVMDSEARAELSDLKGKVEKLELKELVKDCKGTVKKAVKEQRSFVQSEKRKLTGLRVAMAAFIALVVLGVITLAVLFPIVSVLAGPGGAALLPVGIAMFIGGIAGGDTVFDKIESVGRNYQKASKDLSDKEIKLSNLKDPRFVKFAEAVEEISLNEKTLTSKELHDLYSKERKVVDLRGQIDIVKMRIEAESKSIELAKSGKERTSHEKILVGHRTNLQSLDAEKSKLEAEVKKDKTALKAMS